MTSKDMVSLRKGLVKCRRNTQGVHEHSSAAVVLLHLLLRVDTDTCILRKDTWLQAVSVHSALDTDSSSIRGVMSMDNGCEKQQGISHGNFGEGAPGLASSTGTGTMVRVCCVRLSVCETLHGKYCDRR